MAVLVMSVCSLVVQAEGGFFSRKWRYLSSSKELVFYTETRTPLLFSSRVELVTARKIWIPD